MSGFRLPLAVSLAGHAIGLLLLAWLSTRLAPLVLAPPAPTNTVAVMLQAPPAPPPPIPQTVAMPPPIPQVVELPPPIPQAVELPPPIPRAVEMPLPKPKPRRVVRRPIARPVPRQEVERRPAQVAVTTPQTASLAPPVPQAPAQPTISPDWEAAVSEWLAAHKQYPASARERGEEGRGVLRFRVDRSGRVLSYAVVGSTGYPDLDGEIEAMMQGAALPPFPPDMAYNDVTVTIPFSFRIEQ